MPSGTVIKYSPHWHVWTDALYARSLARSARNDWDRGSHVRWCITSAWTAFEIAAEDALGAAGLGHRFRENFDKACDARGIAHVDWGQGVWQNAIRVHNRRIDYLHTVAQADLFPNVAVAEDAILTSRAAIKAVYALVGQPNPNWVDDDTAQSAPPTVPDSIGHLTRVDNVAVDDPARIRTTYVYRDREYEAYVDPPGTDAEARMNDLLKGVTLPITCVRAYRGDELVQEWPITMRGGPRP
jgi:hypothetical protein